MDGSGAGVNIQPVGFLVITENSAKMLPVNHCNAIDKLLDYVPDIMDKIADICSRNKTYTYEFYEDTSNDNISVEDDNENQEQKDNTAESTSNANSEE